MNVRSLWFLVASSTWSQRPLALRALFISRHERVALLAILLTDLICFVFERSQFLHNVIENRRLSKNHHASIPVISFQRRKGVLLLSQGEDSLASLAHGAPIRTNITSLCVSQPVRKAPSQTRLRNGSALVSTWKRHNSGVNSGQGFAFLADGGIPHIGLLLSPKTFALQAAP